MTTVYLIECYDPDDDDRRGSHSVDIDDGIFLDRTKAEAKARELQAPYDEAETRSRERMAAADKKYEETRAALIWAGLDPNMARREYVYHYYGCKYSVVEYETED